MAQVPFTPVGLVLKQTELFGLDDDQLLVEANSLQTDIVNWSLQHFILDDDQVSWLNQQDDNFKVEFAGIVGEGLRLRFDFNIVFIGPDKPKSKNISARKSAPTKSIDIKVLRIGFD